MELSQATGHGSEHGILMDYVKDLNEQKSDKLLLSQGKEIQNEKMKPTQLSEVITSCIYHCLSLTLG